MMKLWSLLACAVLLACNRDYSVPAPVPPPAVGLTGLSPATGWAGQRVTLTGHDLGSATQTEIRFGQSARLAPAQVAADGTSLDVFVPDDATSGPIAVSTPLGQAVTAQPFVFKGLGRLKQNAVSASLDLRVQLTGLIATRPGHFAALVPEASWAGDHGRGWLHVGEVTQPTALAYGPGADQLVVADAPTGCPAGALGRLVFTFSATNPVCLSGVPAQQGNYSWALAADDAATHVVAGYGPLLFLVDASVDPPVITTTPLDITAGAPAVAFVKNDQFLAFDVDGLRPVQFSATPQVGANVELNSSGPPLGVSVNAAKGKAAYCLDGDDLYLLDVSVWPPALITGGTGLIDRSCAGVGLSPDGTRALIGQPESGAAVLVDVSGAPPWLPLTSTPIDTPRAVAVGASLFYVAGRGGVTELSLPLGAVLGTATLTSQLLEPVVRTVAGKEVIDLGRAITNSVVQLDAATFGRFGGVETPLDGDPISQLVSDGKTLWTLHNQEVRRFVDDAPGAPAHEDAQNRWSPADASSFGDFKLVAARDGSALFLPYNAGGFVHQAWQLAVLDTKATWTAAYAPPLYPLEATTGSIPGVTSRVVQDEDGTAWLIDHAKVWPFVVSDALLGKPLPAPIPLSAPPLTGVTALGTLFVPQADSLVGFTLFTTGGLLRVDGAGKATAALLPPAYDLGESADLVISPSGHRLYFLRGSGTERRLVVAEFDPETGNAGQELPSVPLPPGASDLVPFGSGNKLLVLDAAEDRVLLVE